MTDSELERHLETGRRVLEKMSASPCEYIEMAFEAEREALEVSGAERAALRAAVQTMDRAGEWTEAQREAFAAYVVQLARHIDGA